LLPPGWRCNNKNHDDDGDKNHDDDGDINKNLNASAPKVTLSVLLGLKR